MARGCVQLLRRYHVWPMGKFVVAVLVVLVAVAVFAVAGDLFPEGSPLHDMARGIRNVAGDMFGGGYGAVSPG